jgi:tRNA threonylcarbamoyladenosine biosynthesis protein TsaB
LALCAASISEYTEVQVALDAGRNELFYGCYRAHGAIAMREALIKKEELLQMTPDVPLFLFEPGLAQALSRLNPSMHRLPAAIDALTFAIRAAEAGEFADPLTLDANYLRRSDAELFSKPKTTQAIRH